MQRVFGRRLIINSTLSSINLLHNFSQLFFYSTSSSSSSSSSSLSLSSANDFVEYLVNSLGFSHQKALTTSTKLSRFLKVNCSNLPRNAVSVVNLFKEHGFDDAHITKIVSSVPVLLTFRADETIKPKLGFLIDQGISGFDLIRFVTINPQILIRRVDSLILAVIQVLRHVLDVNDALVVVKKLRYSRFDDLIKNLLPNVDLLTSYGVPVELIMEHLVRHPTSFTPDPVKFKDIVIRVEKKAGLIPSSPMFLYGVNIFTGRNEENMESKFRVFKSFGWTQSDVETLMTRNVNCFTLSDENIRKKLDFLINVLGLEPTYLASHTLLLTCSLEKTILPRHDVLQILKAKGLLRKSICLYSAVGMSESRFLNTCVLPFEEVHEVYAKHTGHAVNSMIQERVDDLQ